MTNCGFDYLSPRINLPKKKIWEWDYILWSLLNDPPRHQQFRLFFFFFFFWMGNNLGFNKVLKHRLGSWLTFSSTQITAHVLYLSSQLGSHNHYTFSMQNDEWVENKPMIFWSRGRKWAYSMTRHRSPRLSIGPLSH